MLNYLAVSRQPHGNLHFKIPSKAGCFCWLPAPRAPRPYTTCRLRSCPSSCTLSLCSSSISRLCRSVLWRTSER